MQSEDVEREWRTLLKDYVTKGSPKSCNACVSEIGSEGVEAPIENILSLVKFARSGWEHRPKDYVTWGSPEVSQFISNYTGPL